MKTISNVYDVTTSCNISCYIYCVNTCYSIYDVNAAATSMT